MKYSILMPYYNRAAQLYNTLVSFVHQYHKRTDYEIILIEDAKSKDDLKKVVGSFILPILMLEGDDKPNPSTAFNQGALAASGEFLVITNPECFHLSNILNTFDDVFSKKPNAYIICSCQKIKNMKGLKYDFIKWHQHSMYNPCKFHFCSAIRTRNYFSIGGFDERFSDGVSYEDAAFIQTVIKKFMVISKDDAIVLHQDHSKDTDGRRVLVEKNRRLYESLFGEWSNPT